MRSQLSACPRVSAAINLLTAGGMLLLMFGCAGEYASTAETDASASDGSLSFGTPGDILSANTDIEYTDLAGSEPDLGPEAEDIMPDVTPPFVCTPTCDDRV